MECIGGGGAGPLWSDKITERRATLFIVKYFSYDIVFIIFSRNRRKFG